MIQPKQFSYSAKNELEFFGENLHVKLSAKEWEQQGPVYYYSKKAIENRLALYLEKLGKALPQGFQAHYAVKANSHPELLKLYAKHNIGADVVSGGELKKALDAGIPAAKIIFSGVGKTASEIRLALENQICQINVESPSELKRISKLAQEMAKKITVVLRVNPHVDAKTHKYISTGFRENKFGIDQDSISECLEVLKDSKNVSLGGLSCHIGSQLLDFSAFKEALQKLKKLHVEITQAGFPLDRLDIGGGLGIVYAEDASADAQVLDKYCEVLKEELKDMKVKIQTEPGRFLIARCGVLITQVQYIKKTPYKNFLIVDSGMNHLIRPALYEAYHRVFPTLQRSGESFKADVVGPVCESSDFFAKDRDFTKVEEGDWLALADSGAYGFSMVSLYNSFALPREVFI